MTLDEEKLLSIMPFGEYKAVLHVFKHRKTEHAILVTITSSNKEKSSNKDIYLERILMTNFHKK